MYKRVICLAALALWLGWTGSAAWGQENQLENAEFDQGLDSWALYGTAGFNVEVVQGVHLSGLNAVLIDVTDPTVASIGISQGNLDFVNGQTYPIGLTAKADVEREMVILIQLYKPEGPNWIDIFLEHVTLTPEPQTFIFEYTHNEASIADNPGWVATIYLMLKGQWWAMAGSDLVSKAWIDRVHVGEQPPLQESIIRQAYEPEPEDGGTIDQTVAILKWRAGDFAASHNVYFSENVEEVSEGLVGPIATADERLIVGSTPTYPTGLTPGQTYYWRVDEVNDTHPESPWEGNIWNFLVRPLTAWRPNPPDGVRFVDPNQDLSWEPGIGVLFHTVYFGLSLEEVSTATTGGWMMVGLQHDPGLMEPDTTYYWRVDEFAASGTQKGDVWSFTTAAPGTGGLRAEYFNNRDLSGDPVLTRVDSNIDFDWGGADVPGENSPDESINVDDFSARWTGELEVDLTDTYVFSITANNGFRLWLDGRLIIDYWGNPTTDSRRSEPIPLVAGQTYPLLMEYYEGTGTAIAQLFWESAVQNKPDARTRQIVPSGSLGPPLKAHSPDPANGAVDTAWSLDLAWTAGDGAAQHHVYFGTDAEAVANADTTTADVYRGRQGWTTYNPGALEWGQTYYWRVDEEQADGTVRQGGLWSFTTADFIVVDNFESYTDDSPDRIFQTWIDGLGYTDPQDVPGNGTGSTVGNVEPPFAEQGIVHGGRQSMPMEYDNTFPPYYSEAERTWATPQDWTLGGVDTLTLYVRGHSTNDADPVYVVIEDSTGGIGVVAHPDPAVVTSIVWVEWTVPLTDFTSAGVNLTRVKTMSIGVGDRSNALPGGAGKVYVDDIRVTQ